MNHSHKYHTQGANQTTSLSSTMALSLMDEMRYRNNILLKELQTSYKELREIANAKGISLVHLMV